MHQNDPSRWPVFSSQRQCSAYAATAFICNEMGILESRQIKNKRSMTIKTLTVPHVFASAGERTSPHNTTLQCRFILSADKPAELAYPFCTTTGPTPSLMTVKEQRHHSSVSAVSTRSTVFAESKNVNLNIQWVRLRENNNPKNYCLYYKYLLHGKISGCFNIFKGFTTVNASKLFPIDNPSQRRNNGVKPRYKQVQLACTIFFLY